MWNYWSSIYRWPRGLLLSLITEIWLLYWSFSCFSYKQHSKTAYPSSRPNTDTVLLNCAIKMYNITQFENSHPIGLLKTKYRCQMVGSRILSTPLSLIDHIYLPTLPVSQCVRTIPREVTPALGWHPRNSWSLLSNWWKHDIEKSSGDIHRRKETVLYCPRMVKTESL